MSQELKKYLEAQIQHVAQEQLKANEFVVKANGAIAAYQLAIQKIDEEAAASSNIEASDNAEPAKPGD